MNLVLTKKISQLTYGLIASSLIIFNTGFLLAQDTTSINITTDAKIDYNNSGGNYGNDEYITCEVSTNNTFQSLFSFDLSSIPEEAYILSARIHLFGESHLSNGSSNESYLRRITSSWDEGTVDWDHKPTTTTVDQITLDESTSSNQDYVIDVAVHARDMMLSGNNYGFLLEISNPDPNEEAYLRFMSSDHSTVEKRPFVEIIYEIPDTLILKPNVYGLHCSSANSGAIDLEVEGGVLPYTYEWEDDAENTWSTQNLASIPSENYSITVTDALNVSKSITIGMGYAVELEQNQFISSTAFDEANSVFGCNGSNQTMIKSGSESWSEGVTSMNKLPASTDGWIEFSVDEDDNKKMFGLTEETSSTGNWTSMAFGFYLNGAGDLIAIENGSQVSPTLGSYGEGDVLRITRTSAGISFEKNGIELHSVDNEETYFNYTDVLAVDVNIYDPGASIIGLRASFDNPIRVTSSISQITSTNTTAVITVLEECYSGYSYSLSDGVDTYSSSTITGGVEFTGLNSGDYVLSVSRSGYGSARIFNFRPRDDDDYNWELTKTYKRNTTTTSESKVYFDRGGRAIQTQVKDIPESNVLAIQNGFDELGRPVLTSLPAPLYESDFNIRIDFLSNYGGDTYDYNKFDLPNTSNGYLGEVDNPMPVNDVTKGTVGWYYGDYNDEEKYVATTKYPYSRIEYDPLNPGAVKRSSSPHNLLRMGSGHESESYTMKTAGELLHIYGYANNWAGGNYEVETSSGCNKLINRNFSDDFAAFKSISITPEGKEMISFYSNEGWLLATAYAGKGDDGSNLEVYDVQNIIKPGGDWNERYVDIHLPEGCETTIEISNLNCLEYDILDLRTNEYVYQLETDPEPVLSPGLYRILTSENPLENEYIPCPLENVYVKYNLNYYDYSLNIHDKAGRVIVTVPPLGVELYKPKWSYSETEIAGELEVSTTSGVSTWGIGTVGITRMTTTIPTPNGTNPNQLNVLTFYVDDGTTVKDDLIIENSSKSSESLVTDSEAKAISSQIYYYQYENEAFFKNGSTCSCATEQICINASSLIQAFAVSKPYCPGQYVHLEDKGSNDYCLSCGDYPQKYDVEFELDLELVQIVGENTITMERNVVVVTKYSNGWQIRNKYDREWGTNVPGAASFSLKLLNGETPPTIKVSIEGIRAKRPVLVGGEWDGYSVVNSDDFSELDEFKLRSGLITYNLNEDPEHSLYSLFDYNSKGELISETHIDQGITEYLYSSEGLLRFSQDPEQKNDGVFSYYRYDKANRLIENGEYHYSENDHHYFQNFYYEGTGSGQSVRESIVLDDIGYQFPGTSVVVVDPTFVMYDLPDDNFSYGSYCQRNTRGRISKTRTSNDYDSDPRIETWYSYYSDGSMEWMIQKVYDVLTSTDKYFTVDYSLDANEAKSNVIYQKDVAAEYMEHEYHYDVSGQLTDYKTRTSGAGSWFTQTEYTYYQHGPLKRKQIGEDLQGIDYIYNTMGWLKAINSPNIGDNSCYKYTDPGKDGFGSSTVATDVFGMTIDYFNYDYEKKHSNVNFGAYYSESGSDADMNNWDGKIKSVRWQMQGALATGPESPPNPTWMEKYDDHWMYTYKYNKKNYLDEASFGTYHEGCQNSRLTQCFVEHYPFQYLADLDENYKVYDLSYDANGNIQNLNRRAYMNMGNNRMDELSFNYNSCSNQLNHIDEAYNVPSAYNDDMDDQSTDAYEYNSNGDAIVSESSEGKVNINYDSYGMVKDIIEDANSNNKVVFTYDDKGSRLSKKVYDQTNGLVSTHWYINGPSGANLAIYYVDETETTPALELLEQTVIGNGQEAIYFESEDEYVYQITDQVGNVRAVLERTKDGNGDAVVVASADYYPWGSEMPDRNTNPDYYRHGYQGLFTEKDKETGWDKFELRMWDARMARWMSTDPYGQDASVYTGIGNDPINKIDEHGGHWTGITAGALAGGATGYFGTRWTDGKEGHTENAGWWGIVGAIGGSVAGAVFTEGNITNLKASPINHGENFDFVTPELRLNLPVPKITFGSMPFQQVIGGLGNIGLPTGAHILNISNISSDPGDRWQSFGTRNRWSRPKRIWSLDDANGAASGPAGRPISMGAFPDWFFPLNIFGQGWTLFQGGINYISTVGTGIGSVTYNIRFVQISFRRPNRTKGWIYKK